MTIPVVFSTGSLYPFGLDRSYGWAAEAGYDGVEFMMDQRWDSAQETYSNHLAEKHGILILALHTPLHEGVWRCWTPKRPWSDLRSWPLRSPRPSSSSTHHLQGDRSRAGPPDRSSVRARGVSTSPSRTCPWAERDTL